MTQCDHLIVSDDPKQVRRIDDLVSLKSLGHADGETLPPPIWFTAHKDIRTWCLEVSDQCRKALARHVKYFSVP